MTDTPPADEKAASAKPGNPNWAKAGAVAGVAIGSAAIVAALLYASRTKNKGDKSS